MKSCISYLIVSPEMFGASCWKNVRYFVEKGMQVEDYVDTRHYRTMYVIYSGFFSSDFQTSIFLFPNLNTLQFNHKRMRLQRRLYTLCFLILMFSSNCKHGFFLIIE